MTAIKCEFCGKGFVKGDSVISLVETRPNAHHHLKCVIEAAVAEERECAARFIAICYPDGARLLRELAHHRFRDAGYPEKEKL